MIGFLFLVSYATVYIVRSVDVEGSGEVCNVEGSTCPPDKCCRDTKCGKDKESEGLKCCDDPTKDPDRSNPECANCPKCGKYCNCCHN